MEGEQGEHGAFVSQRGAARLLGMSPRTVRRRVERGDLPAFRDPRNDRVRLLRVADLEALRAAQPVLVDATPGRPGNPA